MNFAEAAKIVYSDTPEEKENHTPYTRVIVSKMAFLTGVPEKYFHDASENRLDEAVYDELAQDKNARIIRNLCAIRTAFMVHNDIIYNSIVHDMKGIDRIDCLPQESIKGLRSDGVEIARGNQMPNTIMVEINRVIQERIGNCVKLFPEWLKFEYIKDMFIMPDGRNEKKIVNSAKKFYQNRFYYPFGIYVNLDRNPDGNLYGSDIFFLKEIYSQHGDEFTDVYKVMDVSYAMKRSIYDFIEESETNTVIVVDCENSDPYKLYATMQSLGERKLIDRVSKIILYDDIHTSLAWGILETGINIPIQHEQVDRVKDDKSLVDMTLALGVSKEHYTNGISSFILYSSDSDYYGLIRNLPDVRFLVMIEESKCSDVLKDALEDRGILYCSIDDFCSSEITSLKYRTVLKALRVRMEEAVTVNVNDLLKESLEDARTYFTTDERNQFWKSYVEKMKITVDDTGNLRFDM